MICVVGLPAAAFYVTGSTCSSDECKRLLRLSLDEFSLPKFYQLFGISKVQSAATTAFRSASRSRWLETHELAPRGELFPPRGIVQKFAQQRKTLKPVFNTMALPPLGELGSWG
jgi:hypothetical protein